jgi:hypothetical protein
MKPLLTFLTLLLMIGGVASAKYWADKDEKPVVKQFCIC